MESGRRFPPQAVFCIMLLLRARLCAWASPVVQVAKHLPAMRETQVQSLGGEDPLEQKMATHSSILARKIP